MGMPAAPAAAPGMMPGGFPGMPGVLPGPPSVGSMGGDALATPIPTPYLGVNGMITADVLDNTDEYKEVRVTGVMGAGCVCARVCDAERGSVTCMHWLSSRVSVAGVGCVRAGVYCV